MRAGVIERPLESHTVKFFAGGDFGIAALQLFQKRCARGETIGDGVHFSKRFEAGNFFNGNDFHFAQAGREADLAGADNRMRPETKRLSFFAGANQFDKVFFEQKHWERILSTNPDNF